VTRRVLIGKFPDGGSGIRISQPGYDVESNPVDNEKLHFNSDWQSTSLIHATGSITCPFNATTSASWSALPYIPFVHVFSSSLAEKSRAYRDYLVANGLGPTPPDAIEAGEYATGGLLYLGGEITRISVSASGIAVTVGAPFSVGFPSFSDTIPWIIEYRVLRLGLPE